MLHGLLVISSWNHQWSTVLPRVLCAISSGPNEPHLLRCKCGIDMVTPNNSEICKEQIGNKESEEGCKNA